MKPLITTAAAMAAVFILTGCDVKPLKDIHSEQARAIVHVGECIFYGLLGAAFIRGFTK
jgi:hypothetical protein